MNKRPMNKRLMKLLTVAFALTIAQGSACDDDPALLDSNGVNGLPSGHNGLPNTSGGDTLPNTSGDGSNGSTGDDVTGLQSGMACESNMDCGEGSCVSGTCETQAALIVSMTWDAEIDLDLHLVQPNGEEVYYRNRETAAGARFAQDSCISTRCEAGEARREMVRYNAHAPGGTYRVFATNYDGEQGATATIEVHYDGQVETHTVSVGASEGATSNEVTFEVQMTDAPCTINVQGYGEVDLENDYIPNVIACENGDAPPEALRAAAIMARGFAYYKVRVERVSSVRNSEADQVYRCSYRPGGAGPEHYAAARATTGQHLQWEGNIIAPFYVAGNVPPNPSAADPINSCNGAGGSRDAGTEGRVTYNYGKFGCDIEMTTLGLVTNDCRRNPHNRGAASQNGQSCLANFGWNSTQMLEYYFGADIEVVNADFCI